MTWMKHTVQNEQANLGRNPLAVSGIARPTKTHMRRGIHRIIGSVSAHVRHSVSSAAAARRTEGLDPEIAHIGMLDAAEVMDLLGCGPRGLTEQQAHRIRSVHGANIIAPEHHDPLAARLSRAFLTPFTLILLALAAISLYTNVYLAAPGDEDPSTAIIIGVMVLISGGISFWQDTRGAAAADALKGLVSITCRCVREDTGAAEIPLADVVPGDLIELAAGDIIPADLRIVTAKDLFLTQAALTGESDPVEKTPAAIAEPAGRALVIDDCTNFAFAGTTVQSGSGTGVVVTTGARTYLGGIASALDARPTTTSFDAGVASVSRVLVGFMLVMCPIVFVLCGLTKGDWLDALLFSISVAVGITPQMLPVIVTTCLARGAEAMRAKDVVVKEISSIQNLGAMDVLCCDKTGTLTRDKIVLERHLDVLGAPSDRVLRHAYLNSLFQTGLRNLMDEAIIERAEALAAGGRSMDARAGRTSPGTPGQAGAGASPAAPRRTSPEADAIAAAREQWRLVDEIPFDFDRRRMSVVVVDGTGKRQLITKGAVEEMLDVCSEVEVDTAVDVAKESADIILLKKDLTVLAHGIVDGRRTYGNTIKYIKTTASSNFGNVLSVLAAAAFLPFLPMSALQLLLLGMAYTVSCAALPWDHVDESSLARPRTWDARGIVSFMLGLGPVSSIFDILTFAAMFWVVCPLVVGAPWAALTDPAQRALFALVFQTGWFVESMWTQTLVIHLLRTERLPFVQSRPAASLTLLTMLGVGLVTAMPYVPGVNSALDLVPLPGVFFGVLATMMAGYLLLTSIAKVLYVRAHGELL